MPTYEYQCANCGYQFELFQSMAAGALKKCPHCGRLSLRRLIGTGAAVLFKGSGFYTTDYRSESYRKAAKADSEKTESKDEKSKSKTTDKKSKVESQTTE